jgi:hypothetical protein
MIEEGSFPRRNPRAVKAMSSQNRATHLAENPKQPYRYRLRTGMTSETTSTAESRAISERANWCRKFVGEHNADWNYRFEPKRRRGQPGELVFLFTKYEDATAFMLRWK